MKKSLEARENLAAKWAVELWHHNPTKIARNKRHSQVLNVSNQMGNRPDRTGTIGVDRPGNQICHILIKIQSLSQKKKKKRFNIYLKKIKKILQESSSHYKDSIFISKN